MHGVAFSVSLFFHLRLSLFLSVCLSPSFSLSPSLFRLFVDWKASWITECLTSRKRIPWFRLFGWCRSLVRCSPPLTKETHTSFQIKEHPHGEWALEGFCALVFHPTWWLFDRSHSPSATSSLLRFLPWLSFNLSPVLIYRVFVVGSHFFLSFSFIFFPIRMNSCRAQTMTQLPF